MDHMILAYPVRDLTTARYLSAEAVNFIAFDLGLNPDFSVSPELFLQTREWIEGPQVIIACSQIPSDELLSRCDGLILPSKVPYSSNEKLRIDLLNMFDPPSPDADYYLLTETFEKDTLSRPCFRNPDLFPHSACWWLNPGYEESVGMADFDQIETWLEKRRS